VGELAASIAHEINQPLSAILTNSEAAMRWLARDAPDVKEARDALARIVRDARRAGDVVERIRALVKKAPPQIEAFDLNNAIDEVVTLTRGALQNDRVSVDTELPTLPPAQGDRVQLQQVVMNLILNGIEAMRAVQDRPRELRIRSRAGDANTLLVAVEDSGPGLDPAKSTRIFDPFFTTKPSGMGMGLSISRSIVEAHGGRLWASPRSPHGAVFQFSLPSVAS
jgi:signal transduction histidine kinase